MSSSPEATANAGPRISAQSWRRILAPYSQPDLKRAAIQLLTTALPLLACAGVMLWGLAQGIWALLVLAVPASFFVVRAFMIQHDCGHGSFFRSPWTNNALGSILGVLTLMPYAAWRGDHAVHHATSGHLGRRGVGDVTTLTVAEYRARSGFQRLLYRFYRHPAVLFGIGPAFVLLVRYRVPYARRLRDRRAWLSILGTNVAAAAAAAVLAIFIGPIELLAGWGTVMLLATAIGVWFFYVQHQFEDTYWRHAADWDFHAAAIEGSSFYDLPNLLHWLTASIGFHHIHHLASKIPNYRLRACFKENPELRRVKRLTVWASVKSVRLALWDEEQGKLVSFREAKRAALAA